MALSQVKLEMVIQINSKAMTKYIMERDGLDEETARKKLMDMEIYKLMIDQDSGIWAEDNEYLCECCEVELAHGVDALYKFFKE
jgi:hypothetical protein